MKWDTEGRRRILGGNTKKGRRPTRRRPLLLDLPAYCVYFFCIFRCSAAEKKELKREIFYCSRCQEPHTTQQTNRSSEPQTAKPAAPARGGRGAIVFVGHAAHTHITAPAATLLGWLLRLVGGCRAPLPAMLLAIFEAIWERRRAMLPAASYIFENLP